VATLVGGFLVPHVPLISAQPDDAPPPKRKVIMDGFATLTRRLDELNVDTVVMIGDDHYTLFGPQCLPRCLIGIGEVDGPIEPWLRIPRRSIENDTALAQHIMNEGFDHGVDWAVSKVLTLDHSIMVPYHLGVAACTRIKMVPIYLSCAVEPYLSSARARVIGTITGNAIRSFAGNSRVAIIGTGGLSHWVGMARMGQVNEVWDKQIIGLAQKGDLASMIALQDGDIIAAAGNGALEIKNWIFAMAALGNAVRAELIAYAPVPEWVCGFSFMELRAA
jgi:protocatechuate 4,5-dioxygenase beta chain